MQQMKSNGDKYCPLTDTLRPEAVAEAVAENAQNIRIKAHDKMKRIQSGKERKELKGQYFSDNHEPDF